MSCVINRLMGMVQYLLSPSEEEAPMKETPPFMQWEDLGLKISDLHMPKELSILLNMPCPIWPTKLLRETHFIFPVPAYLTLEKLYELAGHHPASCIVKEFSKMSSTDKTNWVAITKQIIPNTRFLPIGKQREILTKKGYRPPKLIEAAAAIICAKKLNISLFPKNGLFTRCEETLNEWPVAVGNDPVTPFSICTNDANELNGVAGVLIFDSHRITTLSCENKVNILI